MKESMAFLKDAKAGLVVFLVALPLCLGIAVASGSTPFSGIISGVIGGIIVGLFSGSGIGVSGPAAGLTAIMVVANQKFGFESVLLAVLIAGIMQVIAGIAKLGIIGYYFPSSAIKGMLAGIGIILILKQIPHALGYDKDPEGELGFLQPDGHNTFSEIYYSVLKYSPGALVIFTLCLVVLILLGSEKLKKINIFTIVPPALVVVVLGTITNEWFRNAMPDWYLSNEVFSNGEVNNHLVLMPIVNSEKFLGGLVTFPDFSNIMSISLWILAFKIALVASLETLLCVEATDKLDPKRRVTPTNKELVAQGLGNAVCGLIGGLPVTQVVVRSSANIDAGGQTKKATIFHGVLLLLFALAFPGLLNKIPLASLAAVLVVVGFKLTKPSLYVSMYKIGWHQFAPFLVTIVVLVFTDLLIGIVSGLIISMFFILRASMKNTLSFADTDKVKDDKVYYIKLSQEVTFYNVAAIKVALSNIPSGSKVTIDGSESRILDYDVYEVIIDFSHNAAHKNIEVVLKDITPKYFEKGEGSFG